MKNALIDTVTLTFNCSTAKPLNFLPIPSLNTLQLVFLTYAIERQTDRQTEPNILPTPTDSVGMGNETKLLLTPSTWWGWLGGMRGEAAARRRPFTRHHQPRRIPAGQRHSHRVTASAFCRRVTSANGRSMMLRQLVRHKHIWVVPHLKQIYYAHWSGLVVTPAFRYYSLCLNGYWHNA